MDMINVMDLWCRYETSDGWILKGINLSVGSGEFVGIVGPSGVGKTTLCLTLAGIIPKAINGVVKGNVSIKGVSIEKMSIPEISRVLGIVFQDPDTQLVTMKVLDEVAFPLENLGVSRDEILYRIEYILRNLNIWRLRDRYPFELSGGEKQRVAVASMMARQPEVLILDEPTSDLDIDGKVEVYRLLEELRDRFNLTIIMVDHNVRFLKMYADKIFYLNNGVLHRYSLGEDSYYNLVDDYYREKPDMDLDEDIDNISRDSDIAVELKDVSYTYPNGVQALKNVSLEIYNGDFISIIGPNGSGKTTLVKLISGLLKPTEGFVRIMGIDSRMLSASKIALRVGYVYQNPDHQLFCSKVFDECAFALRNMGLSDKDIRIRVEESLSDVGLLDVIDKPPFFLSKGERQRLALAVILAMDPDIIVVDEPTTGQDPWQSRRIMDILSELNGRGKTIIVITHDLRLALEYTSKTVLMNGGKIIDVGETSRMISKDSLSSIFKSLDSSLLEVFLGG
jgi:energy-coupling factor transport system ATP-binding protein